MATVVTVLLGFQHSEAKEVKIKHGDLTLNANLNLAPGKSLADGIVLMLHGTLAHKDMELIQEPKDMICPVIL